MIPQTLKGAIITLFNRTYDTNPGTIILSTRQLTGLLFQACRMENLIEHRDLLNDALEKSNRAITLLGGANNNVPDEASAIAMSLDVLAVINPIVFDKRLDLFKDENDGYSSRVV